MVGSAARRQRWMVARAEARAVWVIWAEGSGEEMSRVETAGAWATRAMEAMAEAAAWVAATATAHTARAAVADTVAAASEAEAMAALVRVAV